MSDGWKTCPVSDSFVKNKVGRRNQIPAKNIAAAGRFPVVDQGQQFVSGYCDDADKVIDFDLPLIIFGDHTRCLKYVDFPFILGADGTKVILPDKKIYDAKFYYYALVALEIPSRGYNRHFKSLVERSIPLPPLPEQKKIAHILSTVQRAIEEQERIIQTTTELKKALMHKLFTEGLRNEPQKQSEIGSIPKSWKLVCCDDLCEMVTVGVVVKPASHYVESGVPAFRSFNVREDRLVPNKLVYFDQKTNDTLLAKSKLQTGDVLVVRTGYPGTSCVVPEEYDGSNAIDLVIVRPKSEVVRSGFLSRFFNAPAGKRQAVAAKHGLAQQHLNVAAVKRTLVPVPSLEEQDQIEHALATVQQKLANGFAKKASLQLLFRSLLHDLMTAKTRVIEIELGKNLVP
jgi:type I restriction enzyme, S subunit